jgi:predicted O-methyltransferase YrrM
MQFGLLEANVIDEPMGRVRFIAYSALRALLHPRILLEVNPFQVLQAESEFRKYEVSLEKFVAWATRTSLEDVIISLQDFKLPQKLQRYKSRMCLYGLVKMLQPRRVVETGCGGGYGAAFMLHAMEQNECGRLTSIDSSEHFDAKYFALPEGLPCGGMIPVEFRDTWVLSMMGAEVGLPNVLSQYDTIDMFVHDSLHTHDHMTFEYQQAWDHLRPGGLLVSHDIWLPWVKFAKAVNRSYVVYQHYGVMVK